MVVMKAGATEDEIAHVVEKIESVDAEAHVSKGKYRTVIGVVGDRERVAALTLEGRPGVERIIAILKPYKLVSREFKQEDTVVKVGEAIVGDGHFCIIAGPCSVESKDQLLKAAEGVKKAGANMLRGGAFKPRTSPHSFQGLGKPGLEYLAAAREETGLPIVTEVMDSRDLELVAEYADVIQIGARNMQNFLLLNEVGQLRKPILLKRSFGCTLEELLMAAEYIMKKGNRDIILCERGIRTFETATRNTLDLSIIPLTKQMTHLPMIVDPSHATGKRELVMPMTMASLAVGADGVMIEVHPNPEEALCDGPQSLSVADFEELMSKMKPLYPVFDKKTVEP